MRRVLCAVDDTSDAAAVIEVAACLGRALDEPLVLIHVLLPHALPVDTALVMSPVPQDDIREIQEREREHAQRLLERLAHDHDDAATMVRVGDPGVVLADEVARESTSALVVGAGARGRISRAVLGSVSAHLAAHASCPVVVVPHVDESRHAHLAGPVVCGVDGSRHAEAGAQVAARAARRLERPLILVHVLQAGLVLDEVEEREGAAVLDAAAAAIPSPAHLIAEPQAGTVPATLAAVADRERAACVVVGSRGRGAVRSALLGSVSAGTMHEASCPVVVVSPNAHVTPEDAAESAASSA